MYISARERMILVKLLSQEKEMTVKQLSVDLGVSERTVHRDLKNVEAILKKYNINLLKKSGVGIQVNGQYEDVNQLQLMLFNQSSTEFTPEERQTIILCTLLEANDPVKLASLAHDLNVTIVTISNDLNKLERQLEDFGLYLYKKRGYGVEIKGTETAKRRAMKVIILENINEVEFLTLVKENIQKQTQYQSDTIAEKLLGLVEKEKLVIVEKVVDEVNKERGYSIADSAYIGLVVHLALAIERIQHGEVSKMDSHYLERLKTSTEYQIAKKIVERLSLVFDIDISDAETGYVTMHLQGAKLRQDKEYLIDDKGLEAIEKANLLIKFVEEEMHCSLSNNFSLFSGLVTHLETSLFRLEKNMGIYNPLLEKIKINYKELFDLIKKGSKIVFPNMTVPDEEIGFLVLHFGSALLTNNKPLSLKGLIICSTGIGTSKILATRIQREFPEIKYLKNVSLFELEQINIDDFDLVISTVKLHDFLYEYIYVSPILTQEEIVEIRSIILDKKAKQLENSRSKSLVNNSAQFVDKQTTVSQMSNIRDISDVMFNILKHFKVRQSSSETIINVLQETCLYLEENEVIKEAPSVVKALLAREKLGGLGIPNTQLALFHTRSDDVLKPVFLITSLETPLKVQSMNQDIMEFSSLLILLAPEQMSSQQLEILSYISAMIIESKESIALFESKNEGLISSYLAEKLDELYWSKVKEMRD